MIMLIAVEMLFGFGFVVVLIVTWPNPPWTAIQWVGAIILLAGVLIAYPSRRRCGSQSISFFVQSHRPSSGWYEGEPLGGEDSRR